MVDCITAKFNISTKSKISVISVGHTFTFCHETPYYASIVLITFYSTTAVWMLNAVAATAILLKSLLVANNI